MQGEVLTYKEEKSIPKELHESWCQEVDANNYDASKGLGNPCSGDIFHGGVKIKETDGSGCGQKGTTSLSLFMEAYGLEEEEEELSTMGTYY